MKFTLAKSTLVTFVAAGMMAPASLAAVIGGYTFEGGTGVPTPSGVVPNLKFSDFSAGSGLTNVLFPSGNAPTAGNAFSAENWATGVADTTPLDINNKDYFEFSIAPQNGYSVTLTSLNLDERRSDTGIRNWAVRSNLDNYTTSIKTFSVPGDTNFRANQTTTLGATFTNLSSPVTLRLYGYNASSGSGTWRVDNVQVSGSVTPVPFEFSPTLGLLTLGVWGAVAQLRRNRKNN